MGGMQWVLEIVLVVLLVATLFHALRLERALGVLKRDRAVLEDLIAGFNGAAREAQSGVDRLRGAADGAGRQIARQVEEAAALKEDLLFLTERGGQLADRMESLIRHGRAIVEAPRPVPIAEPESGETRVRSQAERDLLKALRLAR